MHWSDTSGLRPRPSQFEKSQCPSMKPKPILQGLSAARGQAILLVRDPMLTSSLRSVIDCPKEIKVWWATPTRSEEHTSELQSRLHLVCRLLLEKKKNYASTTSDQRTCTRPTP